LNSINKESKQEILTNQETIPSSNSDSSLSPQLSPSVLQEPGSIEERRRLFLEAAQRRQQSLEKKNS